MKKSPSLNKEAPALLLIFAARQKEFPIQVPPEPFEMLKEVIRLEMKDQLPDAWSLQYPDPRDPNSFKSLNSEEDYTELLYELPDISHPVKLFLQPTINLERPNIRAPQGSFQPLGPEFSLKIPGEGYLIVMTHPEAKERLRRINCLALVLFSDDNKSILKIIFELRRVTCMYNNENIFEMPMRNEDLCNNEFIANLGFWTSIFAEKNEFKFGLGEPVGLTELRPLEFSRDLTRDDLATLKHIRVFGDRDTTLDITQDIIINSNKLQAVRGPRLLTGKYNLFKQFNLEEYSFISDMPKEMQDLYTFNSQFTIDDEMLKMIAKSVKDPHGIFYEILNKKLKNSPDKSKTYIRIELMNPTGTSPGGSYVLEIWPSKHESKIHNHAGCYGIIQVLYGELEVNNYPWLSQCPIGQTPMMTLIARKGDLTWLFPYKYQIHSVHNRTEDTAISLQCYRYPIDADIHLSRFAFLSNSGVMNGFKPKSDWEGSMEELANGLHYEKEGRLELLQQSLGKLISGDHMTGDILYSFDELISRRLTGILRLKADYIVDALCSTLMNIFGDQEVFYQPAIDFVKRFLELMCKLCETKAFVEGIPEDKIKLFIERLLETLVPVVKENNIEGVSGRSKFTIFQNVINGIFQNGKYHDIHKALQSISNGNTHSLYAELIKSFVDQLKQIHNRK